MCDDGCGWLFDDVFLCLVVCVLVMEEMVDDEVLVRVL